MICPKCGCMSESEFCPSCGERLIADNASSGQHNMYNGNSGFNARPSAGFCPNCGGPVMQDDATCRNCGIPILRNAGVPSEAQRRSRLVAALLAIFFGAVGLDEFYLGNISAAVLRIVLSIVTCGFVGGVWGLINGMKLLTYKINTDGNGYPLREFNF